ncbi:hypothetical protein [Tropicibacter oceani]|uniref:Uncharacterized protein n=1 Tax=Tropicibacter oceani TaxID=3058420 RepID=A0ABY8QK20_9RHOB|nr:hypothetical protein [Tropicibacter oceani]WGW04855.1 hypothetical protein QF118_04700 [Tropicibacter oceani]
MKNTFAPLLIALAMLALPAAAQADCFVEYKAKQDSPLRLHYGILAIGGSCPSGSQAASMAQDRLSAGGWVLLNVLGLSETTPSAKMKANAGDYYLRY